MQSIPWLGYWLYNRKGGQIIVYISALCVRGAPRGREETASPRAPSPSGLTSLYSLYTSSPSLSIQIVLIPIPTLIHDPFHSIQSLYFVLEVALNVTMCIQKQKKCILCNSSSLACRLSRVFIIPLASCDVKVTTGS